MQDRVYISVPKTSEFQSGSRVVKIVLNTWCYKNLSLKMWFHVKKSKETQSNNQNRRLYNITTAPDLRNDQKSPKSRVAESGFTQFLYSHGILDGTWWILMSRRHQICMPKGGRVCLRPSYRRAWPSFQKRNRQHCGVKTNVSPTIFEMELAHLNHFFP